MPSQRLTTIDGRCPIPLTIDKKPKMWELRRRGTASPARPISSLHRSGTLGVGATTTTTCDEMVSSPRKHHGFSRSYESSRWLFMRRFMVLILIVGVVLLWIMISRTNDSDNSTMDHFHPRQTRLLGDSYYSREYDSSHNNTTKNRTIAYPMVPDEYLEYLKNSKDYARQLADTLQSDDCEPQYGWQTAAYPTCNDMHAMDLTHLVDLHDNALVRLLANGYWRDVWIVQHHNNTQRVIKTIRYQHELTLRNYDRNRRDAMALEHLTSSPYIVGIYGYCSTSGLFEFSDGGDITQAIWPKTKKGASSSSNNNNPHLTALRKLQIATQAIMGLAAAHNVDQEGRASIAHTDIGPDQFIEIHGWFKLNDFNRARFITKSKTNGTNCPYAVGKNPGKNRSPEEYLYAPQTEKVDVYSFGNIIYALLQEELPFQEENAKEVRKLVVKGVRPSIFYDVWNSTDPIIMALKDAMIRCHEQDPEQRSSAREIEQFLKAKLEEHDPGRLKAWDDMLKRASAIESK